MPLDVNSERGEESQRQLDEAVEIFHRRYPKYRFFHTPRESTAIIDGVITHNGVIVACVEAKCRIMTEEVLVNPFKNEWLVSEAKIKESNVVADLLQVPLWGFLYLVPDKVLLIQRIYDPKTGNMVGHRIDQTVTKASCNGGRAFRHNMYISMYGSLRLGQAGA